MCACVFPSSNGDVSRVMMVQARRDLVATIRSGGCGCFARSPQPQTSHIFGILGLFRKWCTSRSILGVVSLHTGARDCRKRVVWIATCLPTTGARCKAATMPSVSVSSLRHHFQGEEHSYHNRRSRPHQHITHNETTASSPTHMTCIAIALPLKRVRAPATHPLTPLVI